MATPVTFVLGDISGYTRFIRFHGVSLVHAEKMISELLEDVISTAQPPLVLQELDGDAVTFCAVEEPGSNYAGDVLEQANRCMESFRIRVAELMSEASICLCDACQRAGQLKLKMILHRGEATFMKVRDFNKVGGEDIILAHLLLKNSVSSDEYILMTDAFAKACPDATLESLGACEGKEQVEGFGEMSVYVIDHERSDELEPIERPLTARLRMFAKVEGYLFRRLFSKPSSGYPSLCGAVAWFGWFGVLPMQASGYLGRNHHSVSTSRSSNRTCRFPASGSRTRHMPSHTKSHPQIARSSFEAVLPPRTPIMRCAHNHQCHHRGGHSLPGGVPGSSFASTCGAFRDPRTLTEFARVAPISRALPLPTPALN